MNKLLYLIAFCFLCFSAGFAKEIDKEDVQNFFNDYVNSANSYDENYFDYYSSNARIIRVVEKSDGTKESVNIPLDRYKHEVKKSSKLAKLRRYKNKYLNVKIFKQGDDYKVVAMRMPSTSDYQLPSHFIIGDDNGQLKIKEESMNTRVQRFLKKEE